MTNHYDVIIIGAGSIGVPTAMVLSAGKLKTLVIDSLPSVGQANNKKAIGGLRATHSDKYKIKLGLRSLEVFSTWQETYGDDIQWLQNGYSFPAYTEEIAGQLQDTMKFQHSFGLDITWLSPDEYDQLVPGINKINLIGSTYSPKDGSASPLLAINAFYRKSLENGCEYRFDENVYDINIANDKKINVTTDKGKYTAGIVINAAGNSAKELGNLTGMDLPVQPDSHEAGISEPVKRFFGPMVVDLRPYKESANFYFFQNFEGQVVFCLTPQPLILGTDNDSTSQFLPLVSQRMVSVYPRLANLKVRRTWRGQYPMTPDGFPIIGRNREHPNFITATGFCGQGFMLGPGVAELLGRLVTNRLQAEDRQILDAFSPYRNFSSDELLK